MPPFSQGEVQIAVIQAREGERERGRERARDISRTDQYKAETQTMC